MSARSDTELSAEKVASYQKQFAEKQKQTRTFQAGMKQTLSLHGMREPIVSTGQFYYQAPDKLLIRFTQPAGEFTLIVGKDFYQKKTGKSLAHRKIKPQDEASGRGVQSLLSLFHAEPGSKSQDYDIRMQTHEKELIVTLVPKIGPGPRPRFTAVENHLQSPSLEIQSVRVRFGEDNSVWYEFSKVIRDKPLDSELFATPEEEEEE